MSLAYKVVPLAEQRVFPTIEPTANGHDISLGISVRTHLAGLAVSGIMANEHFTTAWYRDAKAPSLYYTRIASEAVLAADALIAALEEKKS